MVKMNLIVKKFHVQIMLIILSANLLVSVSLQYTFVMELMTVMTMKMKQAKLVHNFVPLNMIVTCVLMVQIVVQP